MSRARELAEFGGVVSVNDTTVVVNEGGNDVDFRVEGDTDANLLFVDAGNDRVGIGTNTPATKLELSANDSVAVRLTSTDTGMNADEVIGTLEFYGSDASSAGAGVKSSIQATAQGAGGAASDLRFYTSPGGTNNEERMRIDSSGNVGIGGTDVSSSIITLNKGVYLQSATDNDAIGYSLEINEGTNNRKAAVALSDSTGDMIIGTSASSGVPDIVFLRGAAEKMRVTGNGLTFNGDTAAANALDDYEEGTFTPTIVGGTTAGTGTYGNQLGTYTKIGNRVLFNIYITWSAHTGTGAMSLDGLPFTIPTGNASFAPMAVYMDTAITLTANHILQMRTTPNSTKLLFAQYEVGGDGASTVAMDTSAGLMIAGHYFV